METDTKIKIKEMTDELRLLSSNFKKKDYPFETEEEKNERQIAISEQGDWGIIKVSAGTRSIENTIEVPLVPATDRGLKFHAAAAELNSISDEFFEMVKSLKELFSNFVISAASRFEVDTVVFVIFCQKSSDFSRQSDVKPPIIWGIVNISSSALPSTVRSGVKATKKSLPAFNLDSSNNALNPTAKVLTLKILSVRNSDFP